MLLRLFHGGLRSRFGHGVIAKTKSRVLNSLFMRPVIGCFIIYIFRFEFSTYHDVDCAPLLCELKIFLFAIVPENVQFFYLISSLPPPTQKKKVHFFQNLLFSQYRWQVLIFNLCACWSGRKIYFGWLTEGFECHFSCHGWIPNGAQFWKEHSYIWIC